MIKKILLVALTGMLSCVSLQAQESITEGMKEYTLVFLVKGSTRTQDSTTAAQIQAGHLDHLTKLSQSGKLNVAGPLLDDGNIRGILIFNSNDTAEVRRWVAADPAVKAGRLAMEIHPWLSQAGAVLK